MTETYSYGDEDHEEEKRMRKETYEHETYSYGDADHEEEERMRKETYDHEVYGHCWYDAHFNFFRQAWDYGCDDGDEYDEYYTHWHEATAPLQHHEHDSNKKILNDVMIIEIIVLQVATSKKCMFCGVNQPITNFLGCNDSKHGIAEIFQEAQFQGYKL
jgi:hypothetical protein